MSSSQIQHALTDYCALYNDELLIEEKCTEQRKQFKQHEEKYKAFLYDFLVEQKKTCLPVNINIEGTQKQIYLRLQEKMCAKSINEDAFKKVLETNPTAEELQTIFESLEDPQATVIDVYTLWMIDKLYEQNTTKKSVFLLSESKEKSKKGEKGKTTLGKRKRDGEEKSVEPEENKVPEEIVKMATQLFKVKHNFKRLTSYKKEKIEKLNAEKKVYEPVLDKFLSTKPSDKQEQKVSMTYHNDVKPFYIRRIIVTKKPTLSLAKSKPVVAQTVQTIFQKLDADVATKPFNLHNLNQMFRHDDFKNLLFADFRNRVQTFKQSNTRTYSSIVVEEESAKKGRKKKNEGDEDEENEDAEEEDDN